MLVFSPSQPPDFISCITNYQRYPDKYLTSFICPVNTLMSLQDESEGCLTQLFLDLQF